MANQQGWRITLQASDQYQTNAANVTQVGVQVYFITGDGNEGSVFVPNQQYNVATVRKMVEAAATLVDEVGRLSSGGQQGG